MAKKLSESRQRQVNYNRLRYNGFTKQEATDLVSLKRTLPSGRVIKVSLLDLNTPFIKTMIKSRARSWERAKKRGVSRVQFEKRVKTRAEKRGVKKIWDLVRVYEKRYTDKHPEYKKEPRVKRPATNDDVKSHRSRRVNQEQQRQQEIDYVRSEIKKGERVVQQESDAAKKSALRSSLVEYRARQSKRLGVDF